MQRSETDAESPPGAPGPSSASGPRKTRRRRLLVSGLIVACVLVFGWIGVIVTLQTIRGNTVSLRGETREVLEAMTTGRAEELYAAAAPRLREHVTRARFLDVAEQMRASLGEFRQIVSMPKPERFRGPSGRSARVRVTADFESGRASGQLSFQLVDDRWLLVGFGLGPVDRAGQPLEVGPLPPPLSAPPEVLAAVREILELSDRGDAAAIHAMAAQSFRDTIGVPELAQVLAMRREVLGGLVEIRELLESHQNRARTRALVKARVAFEARETEVTMRFLYLDDAWRLVMYTAELPRPDIPATRPDDLF